MGLLGWVGWILLVLFVAISFRDQLDLLQMRIEYHVHTFFYQMKYKRKLRKQNYPPLVYVSAPATPELDKFFLLYEIELNTGVVIRFADENTLILSTKEKKIVNEYVSKRFGNRKRLTAHLAAYDLSVK